MKRAILAASILVSGALLAVTGVAAPPKGAHAAPGDAPTVPSLGALMEKDLHWGMTHQELTVAYNGPGGLFDREYAQQLAHLQPGVAQQQVEADRDDRKVNLERSYTPFLDTPTGYDVTPLHSEYTYKNDEAVQRLFKDGKTRYLFYIKDKFWKIYDEVALKPDGPFGATFQDAVTKLNTMFGVPGRIRAADPTQGLERTTADWQDRLTHLRAVDRSNEHIVGIVLEDRATIQAMPLLRTTKASDPFAIDPSISAVTKGGISDPNSGHAAAGPDAGAAKGGKKGK